MSDKSSKLVLKADIDCAECARKVEEGLKKKAGVIDASFNYTKKTLTVDTTLTAKEIMELAKSIEDDIEFPDAEVKKYKIKADIDCAECALEVETALNENEKILNAHFDFPKRALC